MLIGLDGERVRGIDGRTTQSYRSPQSIDVADKIYLLCAVHFGWDKSIVDKQPVDYLRRLIKAFIEDSQSGKGSGGAGATAMKHMGKMGTMIK